MTAPVDAIKSTVQSVTKDWAKQRKAEERDRNAASNRRTRLIPSYRVTLREAAFEVMEEAYLAASDAGSLPVKPKRLGLIGKDHLFARFKEIGVEAETFRYQRALGEADGLPWVVETAFGWCPNLVSRRIIVGVNWSVGLGNPFRSFGRHGGEGLESFLADQRAGRNEPIIFVLHYACPRTAYTDRGKSAVIVPGGRQ